MFGRFITFLRRLVPASSKPKAAQETPSSKERRVWVRYAVRAEVKARLASRKTGKLLAAVLRDVSAGGACLLVDEPLKVGQSVSVEWYNDAYSKLTLAVRIVRVAAAGDGHWSLGCAFSQELEAEELASLETQKVQAAPEDQREWVRYPSTHRASFRLHADSASEYQPSRVVNISAHGMRLVVERPLAANTLLSVNLLDKDGRKVCLIVARVIHSMLLLASKHVVGCHFVRELSDAELELLV